MSSQKYLHEAYLLAEAAALRGEVPVGAVIVFEEKIIASASNTREEYQDPTHHAEILAIQAAAKSRGSWRLIDCDLFVTLEPCPMCLSACQQARVRKVIYGAKDEKAGAICLGFHVHQSERLNHRFEAIFEESEECSVILKKFFANRRAEKKSQKKAENDFKRTSDGSGD